VYSRDVNGGGSMALGAVIPFENVKTPFKVRHIGMRDVHPFSI